MVAAMRGMSVASRPTPMMFTLPKPNGAFRWVQLPAGPALVCDSLAPFASPFFSTRGWKLGNPQAGGAAWNQIAYAAGGESSRHGPLGLANRQAVLVHGQTPCLERPRTLHRRQPHPPAPA